MVDRGERADQLCCDRISERDNCISRRDRRRSRLDCQGRSDRPKRGTRDRMAVELVDSQQVSRRNRDRTECGVECRGRDVGRGSRETEHGIDSDARGIV